MREGYVENEHDAEGWRDPPAPLASTTRDPRLDPEHPSFEWAVATVRSYLDGSISLDQLYRAAHDLLPFRSQSYEAIEEADRERDPMATLVDALWIMALNAVLNDDESELRGYLFDWMPHLERGADVWLAWISSEP